MPTEQCVGAQYWMLRGVAERRDVAISLPRHFWTMGRPMAGKNANVLGDYHVATAPRNIHC